MLLSRHPLPAIPALSAPEKWAPTAVALPLGDVILAAFGARTHPVTVVRWTGEAPPVHREYPAVEYLTLVDDIIRREKEGDFDASSDISSRILAQRPAQLLAISGRPWLVRDAGHARLDPETLEIDPVPRSCVKWLCSLPGGDILAGSGAHFSGSSAFQRFQRGPASLLEGPIFRTRTGLTDNSDWIVEGTTFPSGDAARAFIDGVEKLRPSGRSSFHALGGVAWGGEVIVYGREFYRSGSSRPALVAMDLGRAEVTRNEPVKHEDPFVPVLAAGLLLGFGAKTVVRIDPATLTITDTAELPSGVRFLGHDEARIVVLHKRGKSLLVLDAAAFSRPLGEAVAALEAALAGPAKAGKAKASKASK